jgi:prepilin-type N-terminal cleavage/methylation domain-containing protein
MKTQLGFTLLELIIVMAIMAIAIAVVMPRLSANLLSELKAEVRTAVTIIQYARQNALISAQEQQVLLYPPATETLTTATRPSRSHPGIWVSQGAIMEWDSATPEQQQDGAYVLRFYPGGGNSGATFILKRERFSAKIELHPLTGTSRVTFLEPRP